VIHLFIYLYIFLDAYKRLKVKQDKKKSVLENCDSNFCDQLPYVVKLAALSTWLSKGKGKAVPLQAWSGPEGS